jgi:hypothetical protein
MESLKNKKIIVIRGIAGIGKTKLAAKIQENLKNKNCKIYRRDIRKGDLFITIIKNLADFLHSNGYSKLYKYIEEEKGNDFSEIANYVIEALNSNHYILFYDDYHKLNAKTSGRGVSVKEEMDEFFSKLARSLEKSTIVIISREKPDFIIDNKQKILDVNLEGFDPPTISEYLSKKKLQLKPEQFDKIYKFIQHPWTLSTFVEANNANSPEQKDTNDIIEFFNSDEYKEFLMKRVLSGLSDNQQEILNVMSSFNTPVDSGALSSIIDKDVLEDILFLKNKELITEKDKGYGLHDILKEFCYEKIIPSKKKSLHKSIGGYYMSLDITPENLFEASYHLIKSYGVINEDVVDYFLRAPNDNIYYVFVINEILKDDYNKIETRRIFELFDKFILSENTQVITTFISKYGEYFNKIHKIDEDRAFQVFHKIIESYTDQRVLEGVAFSAIPIAKKYPGKSLEIWKEIVNINKQFAEVLAEAVVGYMNNLTIEYIKSNEYVNFFNEIVSLIPNESIRQYYIKVYNDKWGTGYQHISITDHLNKIKQLDIKESIDYIEKNYKTMNPWFSVQILSELLKHDKRKVIELLRDVVEENKKSWIMILFQVSDILSTELDRDDLNYLNPFLKKENDEYIALVTIRALDLMSNKFESGFPLEYFNPFINHENITIKKIAKITEKGIKNKNYAIQRKIKNVNPLIRVAKFCRSLKALPSILKTGFRPTEPFVNAVMTWGTIKCIEKYDTDEILDVGRDVLNELVLDTSNWLMYRLQTEPETFTKNVYDYGYKNKDMSHKYVSIPLIILMGSVVPKTVDAYLKEIMKDEDEAAFSLVGNLRLYKYQNPSSREEILRYLYKHENEDIKGFADFLLNGLKISKF